MFGITLWADDIKAAPPAVRRWLEQEVAAGHGPGAPQGDVTMPPTEQPTRDQEIRDLIAARAYELWENQGRPSDHHLINWHEAEQEIASCIENQRRPGDPPKAPAISAPGRPDPLTAAAGQI